MARQGIMGMLKMQSKRASINREKVEPNTNNVSKPKYKSKVYPRSNCQHYVWKT